MRVFLKSRVEGVFVKDRAEWRRWLEDNFARREEIWLVFYKKDSGKQTVTYGHAVEEALCFGWVDGMKKKVDEERDSFRFTPRKAKSGWSKSIYPARGAADGGRPVWNAR